MRMIVRHRRGHAFVYTVFIMTAMLALVSLAVDLGHVQLAKMEIERATDAAARYGAKSVFTSLSAAQTAAMDAGNDNTVDGPSNTFVLASSDIQIGNWSGSTFTNNGSPTNAIQVSAARSIPLMFSRLLGMSSATVHAKTVVKATNNGPAGFIGLNGVDIKNNAFVASYNPNTTVSPSHSTYNSNGSIVSNGVIDGKANDDLYGTLIEGPSGSHSGITIHPASAVQTLSTPVVTPTDPTWSPTGNPGGVAQAYTVSSNTTLAGGTYWFTSLTINANLSFSGAATIYVNGNVTIGGGLYAYNSLPSNLKIYQLGTGRTFGDSASNGMDVIAQVSAPGSDFSAKNNMTWRGSMLFNTITTKNNADLYYDETAGAATGSVSVTMVK